MMRYYATFIFLCLTPHVAAVFNLIPRVTFGDAGVGSFLGNGCYRALGPAMGFMGSGLRYNRLMSEEGIMQLAQAGVYKGADAIQEYGSFLTVTSPFIAKQNVQNMRVEYMGVDDEGKCVFDVAMDWYHLHDPTTSTYAAEYNYPIMFKVTFNKKGRADRINVYFAPGFFENVFTRILDSDNTRNTICEIYNENCASILEETSIDCQSEVSRLAVFDEPTYWIDGNTQGCRALHGAFAMQNPIQHCPHISFTGQEDPDGKVNCHTSLGVDPESLFDERDVAFWDDYCQRFGFDPAVGFREIL